MKFFADTAEIAEIRELAEEGLLDGVTTNPSLVHKSGRDFMEVVKEIAGVVDGSGHGAGVGPFGRPGCVGAGDGVGHRSLSSPGRRVRISTPSSVTNTVCSH